MGVSNYVRPFDQLELCRKLYFDIVKWACNENQGGKKGCTEIMD